MSLKDVINNWCLNRLEDLDECTRKKIINISKILEKNNYHHRITISIKDIQLGYITSNNLNYLQLSDLIIDYLEYKKITLTQYDKFILQSEQEIISKFQSHKVTKVIDIYQNDKYILTVNTLNDAAIYTNLEKNTIAHLLSKKRSSKQGFYFMYRI